MEFCREVDTSTPTMMNVDLPAELRCSLCNSIFKEAVMIPCCQHSFCDKCKLNCENSLGVAQLLNFAVQKALHFLKYEDGNSLLF